jgi:hypothetical protein
VYKEVLSGCQKRVISHLSEMLRNTDFYLAGGTALALHIGHRVSVDLDWFVPFLGNPENLLNKLKSYINDFNVTSISTETAYLIINNVQVSFIGYNYPLLESKVIFEDYGICLASLDDIACMKLSAIAGRGAKKDFIDLYFLINYYKSLQTYLDLYRQKFSTRDIGHVIRSLIYFEDAELEPDIHMLKSFSWSGLKKDFEYWVKQQ